MATQPVTLQLPGALYERFQRQAERSHRTIEDELLDVVATAVPAGDELSAELEGALSPLAVLDDAALWNAARAVMPADAAEELDRLHQKRQRDGLTAGEADAAEALVRQYGRTMLVRAHAAALLQQRGHDVSSLLRAA